MYAEFETKNKQFNAQQLKPKTAPLKLQQEDCGGPSSSSRKDTVLKRATAKKAMSTSEAIAALELLCKQEDPYSIYTDMVKIGEG